MKMQWLELRSPDHDDAAAPLSRYFMCRRNEAYRRNIKQGLQDGKPISADDNAVPGRARLLVAPGFWISAELVPLHTLRV